jgi:RNA polymerase sigma factor (sigma-70 family)
MHTLAGAQQTAQQVVMAFVRRVPGAAQHTADMTQEALLAILQLEKRGSFDESRGDWGGYSYRAAEQAVGRYLYRNSGPVSATRKVKGLKRTKPVDVGSISLVCNAKTPQQEAEDAQLAAMVRQALRMLDGTEAAHGFNALVNGLTPAEVAARHGVPAARVSELKEHLLRRAKRSTGLRALYEEIR